MLVLVEIEARDWIGRPRRYPSSLLDLRATLSLRLPLYPKFRASRLDFLLPWDCAFLKAVPGRCSGEVGQGRLCGNASCYDFCKREWVSSCVGTIAP